jgi:hypothetical protein
MQSEDFNLWSQSQEIPLYSTQSNPIDEIVKTIAPYGTIGIIFAVLVAVLILLWVFLPFAVFPLHGSIRNCYRELRMLNRKMDQLIEKVPIETKES